MFDMNQCKPGDKLVSCHGMIFKYIGIDESLTPYRHVVQYPNGSAGSRIDDGSVFVHKKLPTDHDIIGFYKESV